MDATELLGFKRTLRETIRDAVEQRDRERLLAISATVHELELELLESFWELHQALRGIKPPPRSQLSQRVLSVIERMTRGYAVGMMSLGVTLSWKAAGIRSQIKGAPVRLDFEAFGENSSPLG